MTESSVQELIPGDRDILAITLISAVFSSFSL